MIRHPEKSLHRRSHEVEQGVATIRYIVNSCGPADTATFAVEVNQCTSTLNLTAFIQGYYDSTTNLMSSALMNSSVAGASSLQADTITVEIHDGATGAIIGSPVQTMLMTNGTCTAVFPALSGRHYIVLKHRNAMELWSADSVLMGPTVSYNFSTSASQAYGDNQAYIGDGLYGMWSGDVNGDGIIEGSDYLKMETDVLQILFGYYNTDLTGDGIVEGSDYLLMEQNVLRIIFVARPY